MNFTEIDGVISDMDGVLWRGSQPLPGLIPFFEMLRARNIPFALATNNSSQTQDEYVAKLESMGLTGIAKHQILTSGTITVDYLKSNYPTNTPVYIIGSNSLKRLIDEAGYPTSDEANLVVVGIDTQLTYDKLKHATLLIRKGATFIGTNDDANVPRSEGIVPGAGSILAALQTATECEPKVMGKPFPPMFVSALHLLGTLSSRTLMIGDRLNTDIWGAQDLGLQTALVLTGISSRADTENTMNPPDGVYADLAELTSAWQNALGQ